MSRVPTAESEALDAVTRWSVIGKVLIITRL